MELTPQSARSPTPLSYHSNPESLYEYPSPAQSDSRFRSTEPIPGTGLYSCSMPGSNVEESLNSGANMHISATNDWAHTTLQQNTTPRASQSGSSIMSAEYDPFAPYHNSESAPYTHDIYSAHLAEVVSLPVSPVPSGNTSQRSSFSSAPASEVYTQAGSIHSYTPRIKMEDNHSEYATSNDSVVMMSSPQISHTLLSTAGPYHETLDASYYHGQSPLAWSKDSYSTTSQDLPSISTLPLHPHGRGSESHDHLPNREADRRKGPSTFARTKGVRKLTSKEDANFQCTVKGCGKLFGRSYNYKAHMETHDALREYPFPCPTKDCNKKFVRKTDLQRHHQSVHMKQRNHRCDYCSRFFARKDTLRRHMEDGCSKRFDIETVDFRPQTYGSSDQNSLKSLLSRPGADQQRQASYNSSHYTPSPGVSTSQGHGILTSTAGEFPSRHDYIPAQHHHEPLWSN
ncbi:hypothetical protein BJ878DRAFT_99252 [Calycina marina]|uniref:C2H2-type domain-containing protein n=1 Tax=Calycina marina TaxID=1763456 RepID=A0A9P7ZAS8_9HELO|nr:hypothetical protein BJ878DRAFT_99252 [Calycina marina]